MSKHSIILNAQKITHQHFSDEVGNWAKLLHIYLATGQNILLNWKSGNSSSLDNWVSGPAVYFLNGIHYITSTSQIVHVLKKLHPLNPFKPLVLI